MQAVKPKQLFRHQKSFSRSFWVQGKVELGFELIIKIEKQLKRN